MHNYFRNSRIVSTFVFLFIFLLANAGNAIAQTSAHSQARITENIDTSRLVVLRGNTHPLAQPGFDRGLAPLTMPASRLLLVLQRSTQQEADLRTYLQSVQDSNSPNYRRFLSPEEFGLRFGVSDADLQTIQGWLTGNGFTVSKVSKSLMAVEFSGTVGQVQTAFHTSLHRYVIDGNEYWANAGDPQIPSALAPVVAGVTSLNSFKPKAQYIRGPSGVYDAKTHKITPTYTIGDSTSGYYIFLGPADAATIYDTPTKLNAGLSGTAYDGTGVTIGIAGDSNINVTQNANYRATFGLAAKATTVVVDGNDPGENGDALEAYLDTQVSGGIAPNANVILYTAANTDFEAGLFLAINRALDDNQADILNVSFSGCEAVQGTAGNQYILDLWEQAAAQGISVTVSSGDSGSAGCDNPDTETHAVNGLGVNGLGSTPFNVSVGGTDFDVLYSSFPTSFSNYVDLTNTLPNHRSALEYIPEEPWNDSTLPNTSILDNVPISVASHYESQDNIVAGGGGLSTVYAAPDWQSGFGSTTARSLPDVSFLAGNGFYGALWGICTDLEVNNSGNHIADCAAGATGNNFNLTGVGGTSASSPAFAGMLALVKQKTGTRLGQADYVLYHLAKTDYSTVFHDVVTGDNSVECNTGTPNCKAVTDVNTYYLSGYNAASGYDEASGLGSVDASQLASNWESASFNPTTSSLQLNGATTALNITHGQSVSVNAKVSSTGGTPSGNVALVDSLSPANRPNVEGIADFSLSAGSVSGTTDSLPGGTYNVSAHYGGSNTFAESDSNTIPVTVAAESSTTTFKVAGYYDPATGKAATTPYYGYIYLLDAQPYGNSASATEPNGAATGTITFKNGTAKLGTASLSSEGIAELQAIDLPGGSNSLTASFPGDASFKASISAPYLFTVEPALTTLVTDNVSVQQVDSVNLGVTLTTKSGAAAPTGTVTFENGSTIIGSAKLEGFAATKPELAFGVANLKTYLLPGSYRVVAVYSGDSNYSAATAAAVSVSVDKAHTTLMVTPTPTTIDSNQAVQFAVTPYQWPGLPLPTGSVVLSYGSPAISTPAANLVNGTVTMTIPANSLPGGNRFISASYSGDSNYWQSNGGAPLTVIPSGTITPTVVVTTPANTVNFPVAISVTVKGTSGEPVPTGSVLVAGAEGWLTNGSTSVTFQSGFAAGPNTIPAKYQGDSNYTPASGKAILDLFANPNITFKPASPTLVVNQSLTVTVSVGTFTTNNETATGTVTILSGTYSSPPTQLTSGSASITIPANSLATLNTSQSHQFRCRD